MVEHSPKILAVEEKATTTSLDRNKFRPITKLLLISSHFLFPVLPFAAKMITITIIARQTHFRGQKHSRRQDAKKTLCP